MKRILVLVLVIVVTSLATLVLRDFLSEEAMPEGVIKANLFSNILNEEREIIVHLPINYDSTLQYLVIYVLDGSSEDWHVAEKFNVLSAAGYAPQTIVVGIPNLSAEDRERNLTPPFMRLNVDEPDSPYGEGDKFLSFMESELFPFVEKNFGASPVRLFHGHSRAGLLVMYSLLSHPDLFQARFCYSAPFWRFEDIMILKTAEFLQSRDTLKTFLYMSAGENETEDIKGGLTRMSHALESIAPAGLIWYSSLTPNAIHQTNSKLSASDGIGKWCEYIKH